MNYFLHSTSFNFVNNHLLNNLCCCIHFIFRFSRMQLRSGSLGKRIIAMNSSEETNGFETSSVQLQPMNDTICCPRPSSEKDSALLCTTTRRLPVSSSSDDQLDSTDNEETNHCQLNKSADTQNKKKFVCDICVKEFKSKSAISYHMKVHKGARPYKCDHCLKAFSSQSALNLHRKTHLPPAFKCDFCPTMFAQKINRDRHMNTHTGVKPYECELCDERFAQEYGLKVHRERHQSTERKHKCEVCFKTFATSSCLSQHRKAHLARYFECPFCNKKFSQSSNCRTHWKGNKRQAIGCKVRLSQLAKHK